MGDIDSAGVYFLSVEDFESRTPPPIPDGESVGEEVRRPAGDGDPIESDGRSRPGSDDQPDDATKSASTRPSSSPQSS